MKLVLYPTLQETLELHNGHVPDLGLLESALMRPQSGYYDSLSLQAAALLQSLTFIDGNKRVAFATTAIFLRMNGFRLKVDPDNGESFLIETVIGKMADLEVISLWLEKHMKKV